jgi:hypothetical protein
MSENETSTGAGIDGRPNGGAGKTIGHPMDAVLQRIFKDPSVTLESELQWIRTEMEKRRALANGQPDCAAAQAADDADADQDADEDDDVVEDDLDPDDAEADAGAEAQEGHASNGADTAPPVVPSRQADRLVALAESVELFRTPEGDVYGDLAIDGHRETWPIRSKAFRRWLTRRFFESHHSAPSTVAMHEAVGVIEAKALADSSGQRVPERTVHVRVAGLAGKLYLDLGDAAWRAVEIDEAGWRVVAAPPVRFRRPASQRALPVPEADGSIDRLASFLNLRTEADLVLVVAWALAALRDRGPCPILALTGEQGSGKSTCMAMLQALIDPTALPPRGLPGEDRELIAAGRAVHVLAFDNLSAMPPWCADALCRRIGGAGVARPVILNGIVDLVVRPDLADRALVMTLDAIPEDKRRPEAELWLAFEAERPRLLGALLTAVAEGLQRVGKVRPPALPRLADFVLWATACQPALWPAGTFGAAFEANCRGAVIDSIDGDPLADAVLGFAEFKETWEGTASELMIELWPYFDGKRGSRAWPGSSRVLAARLRQHASLLRPLGIEVSFRRHDRTRARLIRLEASLPTPDAGTRWNGGR